MNPEKNASLLIVNKKLKSKTKQVKDKLKHPKTIKFAPPNVPTECFAGFNNELLTKILTEVSTDVLAGLPTEFYVQSTTISDSKIEGES